jgi:hypothetical protein
LKSITGIRQPVWPRVLSLGATALVLSGVVLTTPASATPLVSTVGPPKPADQTIEQALIEASRTGKAVEATAATTENTSYTANPNGTITLVQHAAPVRKKIDGTWHDLNADLAQNADGTWSPKMAQAPLALSNGGDKPMAVVGHAGLSATIDAPMNLPEPTVSGATATYAGVLPGVDLQVTANTSGGFSEVFVVHDAEAAKNEKLAALSLPISTEGLTVKADAAGNVTGKDRLGRNVLTAPAPTMWDSTEPAGQTRRDTVGLLRDSRTGRPAESSISGPGTAARTARIGAKIRSGHLHLTPDKSLLTGGKAKFPVYIDPTFVWNTGGGAYGGWATVSRNFPSTNYWKNTPDPRGRLQVGNSGEILSRTLLNFTVDTTKLAGAEIGSAQVELTQTWSYSCTASRVNLYAPSATLTSGNATWNYWNGQNRGSVIDYKTTAHGYNSSCPAKAVAFDVKDVISANVNAASPKKTQTFLLAAADESDTNGWKEFLETSGRLELTYNHKPNTPTSLTTSPASSCNGGTVGEGYVTLSAFVSDRNESNLDVTFRVWQVGVAGYAVDKIVQNLPSGSNAKFRIDFVTLRDRTPVGGKATFNWAVASSDGRATSAWANCKFVYDRSRPGAPDIVEPDDFTTTVGQTFELTVNPPVNPGDGTPYTLPSGYIYQLNGGKTETATATNGVAKINVTPTRFANTLNVTAQSGSGNVGANATVNFLSNLPAKAADGDLDGDGTADFIAAGKGNTSSPAGLWLSSGLANGAVDTTPTNVGSEGSGGPGGKPADFNGTQILTGHFNPMGVQDVIAYYPPNHPTYAGGAAILFGNGIGSPYLARNSGNYSAISPGSFAVPDYDTGAELIKSPLRLANAGSQTTDYPDLIGIASTIDDASVLTYYPNAGSVGGYTTVHPLTNTTPTGGTDWSTWTITSAQTTTGTALFLWQASSGKLYLWNKLAFDSDTTTIGYQQHLLSAAWNAGKNLTLRAADFNKDGTADLWAQGTDNKVLASLVTDLNPPAGTGRITSQVQQLPASPTHSWALADCAYEELVRECTAVEDGQVKDTVGDLHNIATSTATWVANDLFSPSIALNGKDSVITTAKAVDTTKDFSVSLWTKPTAFSGNVVSQDGTNGTGFKVWPSVVDSSWQFGMQRSDSAFDATQFDTAKSAPNTVKLGMWYHLTVTFERSSGRMSLYVNGELAGTATHTSVWASNGNFRIGAFRVKAQSGDNPGLDWWYQGQVAAVQTWNTIVEPPKAAAPTSAWKLNEGTGTVAADSGASTTKNPATLTAVTWGAGRLPGTSSAAFNGTTGYGTTSGAPLDTSKSFTVSAWVRMSATDMTKDYVILARQPAGAYSSFYLLYNGPGQWGAEMTQNNTGTTAWYRAHSTAAAVGGEWTHLAAVYDATAKTLTLYVNGTVDGKVAVPAAWNDSTKVTWIGRSAGTYFPGNISDVRIWNQALPTDSVKIAANS